MSLFVFFISLLIVAQHVSGNHVPIIRSWRLRDVIASYFALKYLSFTLTLHLAESDTRYEDQIYSFPSMTLLLSLTVVYSEKKRLTSYSQHKFLSPRQSALLWVLQTHNAQHGSAVIERPWNTHNEYCYMYLYLGVCKIRRTADARQFAFI